ncbi:MAG TPA: type II toxin-antitoxin system prevent-host-death family antitoxin [Coriobacteriia bacterium]
MTTILVMTEERTLADVKAHFSEIIELVQAGERVVVTKRGKAAAVIIDPRELEGLEETLDILAEPGALEEIRQSEMEIAAGHYYTEEDVRRELLERKDR